MVVAGNGGIPDPNPVQTAAGGFAPRRVNIRKKGLEKYGSIGVCIGCQMAQVDLPNRVHTEECRQRILEAMAADDVHRGRVERANARQSQYSVDKDKPDITVEEALRQEREMSEQAATEAAICIRLDADADMGATKIRTEEEMHDN